MVELYSWIRHPERLFTPYSTWNVQRGSASITVKARDIGEAQEKALPLLRRIEDLTCKDCRKKREHEILRIIYNGKTVKIQK